MIAAAKMPPDCVVTALLAATVVFEALVSVTTDTVVRACWCLDLNLRVRVALCPSIAAVNVAPEAL